MLKEMVHLIVAIFLAQVVVFGENTYNISSLPVRGYETAVLVLAPGINAEGNFFLEEQCWTDFAKKNNLGMIALSYKTLVNETDSGQNEWYYYPNSGSGQALLDSIRKVYGKDLPIILYGFSGGAQFVSRFVDWCPDRIIAWCAYSAQFWDYPQDGRNVTKARGIVACGDQDGLRWQPSFSFYYKGRMKNRPWIWISVPNTGHVRNPKLEEFVRSFFIEELKIWHNRINPQNDILADISTKDIIYDIRARNTNKALKCQFRNFKLLEQWKEIQSP